MDTTTKQFNVRLATSVVALIDRIAESQASSQASVVTQAIRLLARRDGIASENKAEMRPKKTSRNPK